VTLLFNSSIFIIRRDPPPLSLPSAPQSQSLFSLSSKRQRQVFPLPPLLSPGPRAFFFFPFPTVPHLTCSLITRYILPPPFSKFCPALCAESATPFFFNLGKITYRLFPPPCPYIFLIARPPFLSPCYLLKRTFSFFPTSVVASFPPPSVLRTWPLPLSFTYLSPFCAAVIDANPPLFLLPCGKVTITEPFPPPLIFLRRERLFPPPPLFLLVLTSLPPLLPHPPRFA